MTYPDKERIYKVLDKIKSGKLKVTELIDESASPIDRMKFNICQQIIKFKRQHDYNNKELAQIIGVGPAVVTRLLYCQIDRFKIDTLLNYYSSLLVSTKNNKLLKKFNEELAGFLKELAA
jgi:hypothetical protein